MIYLFQEAKKEDIQEILKIANEHYLNFKKEGFLISDINAQDIEQYILNKDYTVNIVKNIQGDTLAFGIAKKTHEKHVINDLPLEFFDFKNEVEKSYFYNKNHLHLEHTAVKKGMTNQRIGTFYYQKLLNNYPTYSFSANVITKPMKNNAALESKRIFEFEPIASFNNYSYNGLYNFESVLMLKKNKL